MNHISKAQLVILKRLARINDWYDPYNKLSEFNSVNNLYSNGLLERQQDSLYFWWYKINDVGKQYLERKKQNAD